MQYSKVMATTGINVCRVTLVVAALTMCATAQAADNASEWTMKITPQFTYGPYSGAPTRDSMTSTGIYADAQYLERGGITVGAIHTDLKMKQDLPTLRQNGGYLSGRLNFTPDFLPGRITVRADVHQANNNDVTNETDHVSVFAPQVSFLSFDKTKYVDLGYAHSSYGDSNIGNGSLTVTQWTPTVGFGFNQGADWLQVRLYDERISNELRALNKSSTDAVEAKWTHYFLASKGLIPEQVQLGALIGERIYAVDGDSAVLYNLSDMQRGGVLAGAQWKIASNLHLLINGGYDRYETQSTGVSTKYNGEYIYTGISAQW